MEKEMDSENIIWQMVHIIKDNGKMENYKEKENIFGKMEESIKENGNRM